MSDNLATNLLLRRVGLDAVAELTARLGVTDCGLHDFVRDERRAWSHPPFLSSGCADELAALMGRLAAGELVSPAVSRQVRAWLATNTDLSMVAAPFSLDPLAHGEADLGVRLVNKTGTNAGTRADVGHVTAAATAGEERTISYAVIARWSGDDHTRRTAVLGAMWAVGANVRAELLGR